MKVEFSNGDIVDRYIILSIKLDRIISSEKKRNVQVEYDILTSAFNRIDISMDNPIYIELQQVNKKLWDIEDAIRIKEKKKEFDDEFIQLARSVYIENDKRAKIKKQINQLTHSSLIEEKQYDVY